jgi:hypothetical protein
VTVAVAVAAGWLPVATLAAWWVIYGTTAFVVGVAFALGLRVGWTLPNTRS